MDLQEKSDEHETIIKKNKTSGLRIHSSHIDFFYETFALVAHLEFVHILHAIFCYLISKLY